MRRPASWVASSVATIVTGAGLAGCLDESYTAADRTDRRPRELRVVHQVGGTQHRAILHDGTWYQSKGSRVLAIDPRTGRLRGEEVVAPAGTAGPIVDMTLWKGDLFVVLDESAVARLVLTDGRAPSTVELIGAESLGLRPRTLSVVGEHLYVSGDGGIVRLPDRARFLAGSERTGRVVGSDAGLVTTIDRRVVTIADGSFVGAATELAPLPDSLGLPGGLLFVLQGRDGATVGLMGPDVRERANAAVFGRVRRAVVLDDRLWVATDLELSSWRCRDGALDDLQVIRIKGVRDLDAINDNYFVVAGSFGRAVMRFRDDAMGPGDEFLRIAREPGRIDMAISDRRTTVGSSPEGTWNYAVRGEAKLTEKVPEVWSIPSREVTAVWGRAKLVRGSAASEGEFGAVEIAAAVLESTWRLAEVGRIWTIEVVDGDLWIGHDRGISVLRQATAATPEAETRRIPSAQSPALGETTGDPILMEVASLRLEGPILFIFPLRTGNGASWVSRWGGFGVAEWVAIDETPPATATKPASKPAA